MQWRLKLTPKFWHLSSAPDTSESIFTSSLWATLRSQQLIMGPLGHEVSALPLEELETQPHGKLTRLVMWSSPSQTSRHQVSDELPWSAILDVCCYTSLLGGADAVYNFIDKRHLEIPPLEFSWTLPHIHSSLIHFNVCPFTETKHNCKYNSFQWVLRVFFGKLLNLGDLWTQQSLPEGRVVLWTAP